MIFEIQGNYDNIYDQISKEIQQKKPFQKPITVIQNYKTQWIGN